MDNGRRLTYMGTRKDWRGHVLFAFGCINLCHGFGKCSYCDDNGVVWRKPSPYSRPSW